MFVYLITNSDTMKIYVGKTIRTDLGKYLREKIWCAQRARYGGRSHLFNAMQKYPSTVWSIKPLYRGVSDSDICEKEKLFIKELGAQNPKFGYNICDGGQGFWDLWSDEMRQKQSRRMKKVMNTPEVKLQVSMAQQERFSDPKKSSEFKQAHNTEKARKQHSSATQQRLSNPKKRAAWVAASHSESARVKRSSSLQAWHSSPETAEKRKLRGQRISQFKKAQGHARPAVDKLCPNCTNQFMVSYKERDQVCCSKGCATSLRMRKLGSK